MQLAPIALFVFNRPEHTRKTIAALAANDLAKDSVLYIFSDGFRSADQAKSVEEVRKVISKVQGFKEVRLVLRDQNFGLARNITEGVSSILVTQPRVIVLEDDLITAPNFLEYMNSALEKYDAEKKVCSITGYSFTDSVLGVDSTFFLSFTSSWSWATWSDRWPAKLLDDKLLNDVLGNPSTHHSFNYDGSYDFLEMTKQQLQKQINSWAIYWRAYNFSHGKLTLYPAKRMVQNIGFDGSGTHAGSDVRDNSVQAFHFEFTDDISEKLSHRSIIAKKLKSRVSFKHRILNRLKGSQLSPVYDMLKTVWIKSFKARNSIQLFFYTKKIGERSYVDPSVNVFGWKHTSIGKGTLVGENSWLNVNNRIENFVHIDIGNFVYIGRRNLISSSRKTMIGDYVMTNNECKFLASNHVFNDPTQPYITTGTTNDSDQIIEPNVWIGASTIVLGGVTIGRGSIIGAGSVVTKSIPPFSIAVGNPCVVKKRYSFKTKQWVLADEFKPDDEKDYPSVDGYLETLRTNQPSIILPQFAATSRFGDLLN